MEISEQVGRENGKSMNGLPTMILIALTIMGEARGEGEEGMRLVASVIYNRANGNKYAMADIATDPAQFSCWRKEDPSLALMHKYQETVSDAKAYETAIAIALEMKSGNFNPTTTATHYCRKDCKVWWRSAMAVVGKHKNHIFYREG